MKRILFLIGILVVSLAHAQDTKDPTAKKILDKLSKKTKAFTSIKAEFTSTLDNKKDNIKVSDKGSVLVKGDKYVLTLGKQKVICDGKTVWTYDGDANEVYITNKEVNSEDVFGDPSKIFTLYENNFKYLYIGADKGIQTIKLYPEEVKKKSYHTIELQINEAKNEISGFIIYGKDGNTYTYVIKLFKGNIDAPDSNFTYNSADYPGAEEIDDR